MMSNNSSITETEVNPNSEEELIELLKRSGIDVSLYGQRSTKTIFGLLKEIRDNETKLFITPDNKLIRRVLVARAKIQHPIDKSKLLFEATQNWKEIGRVRSRNIWLSGKMNYNEKFEESIIREVKEELGSILSENPSIIVDLTSITTDRKTSESASYPGLISEYFTYTGLVEVKDLPLGNFITEENTHEGILEVLWEWREL